MHEGLEQPHQQVEREVLPAVGVARQLEIEARSLCRESAGWLVREQQLDVGPGSARRRSDGIGPVARRAAARGAVGDARDQHPGGSLLDHLVGIDQRVESEALDLAHPAERVPVVLVIPGDEELAVRRAQTRQRSHVVPHRPDMPVGHVTGERDQVRREPVRRGHHALDEAPLESRADVQVGKLDDAKTIEIGRQPGNRHFNPHHPRLPGPPHTERGHDARHQEAPAAHQPRVEPVAHVEDADHQ